MSSRTVRVSWQWFNGTTSTSQEGRRPHWKKEIIARIKNEAHYLRLRRFSSTRQIIFVLEFFSWFGLIIIQFLLTFGMKTAQQKDEILFQKFCDFSQEFLYDSCLFSILSIIFWKHGSNSTKNYTISLRWATSRRQQPSPPELHTATRWKCTGRAMISLSGFSYIFHRRRDITWFLFTFNGSWMFWRFCLHTALTVSHQNYRRYAQMTAG